MQTFNPVNVNGITLKVVDATDNEELLEEIIKQAIEAAPFPEKTKNLDRAMDMAAWFQLGEYYNRIMIVSYSDDTLQETTGFIAGIKEDHLFLEGIAQELGWYVKPEYRSGAISKTLLTSFEEWAKLVGATHVSMATLNNDYQDRLERIYDRLGYEPAERTYIKEL